MKTSAGLLLYKKQKGIKVLIVHPSGFYNQNAAWSIPKGEVDEGEEIQTTAIRETFEEIGVKIDPDRLMNLGWIVYKSKRKKVFCYAAEVGPDTSVDVSSWEIDKAEWVTPDEAKQMLHADQAEFVTRLLRMF